MTDRLRSLTVVLERDMRDDDAEHLIALIGALKGVAAVAGDVVDSTDYAARARVRCEVAEALWNVARGIVKGETP